MPCDTDHTVSIAGSSNAAVNQELLALSHAKTMPCQWTRPGGISDCMGTSLDLLRNPVRASVSVFCLHQKNGPHGQEANLWPRQPQQQIILLLSSRGWSGHIMVAMRPTVSLFFSPFLFFFPPESLVYFFQIGYIYGQMSVKARRSLRGGYFIPSHFCPQYCICWLCVYFEKPWCQKCCPFC